MTSPDKYMIALSELEARIDYVFNDKDIALLALTHSSYGDGRRNKKNNERLEFLGDRVLGLLTAKHLFSFDASDEGSMARRLNALVRKETCARVARSIDLGNAMRMSPAEVRQGGRDKTSILGDACEALLAALFIDGGLDAVLRFYEKCWGHELERILSTNTKDPKTKLQEIASARNFGQPVYTVVSRTGPDHEPQFVINVSVDGVGDAQGTSTSKKDAQRRAAKQLLEIMDTK